MDHDFALTGPAEEQRLLRAIFADRWHNRTVYEVYADWLDHHEDSAAGDVVRTIAGQIFDGAENRPVPPIRGWSWFRMLGKPWSESLAALDEAQRRWVRSYLRPIVTLDATPVARDALAIGQSRLGGDPDLPVDFEWPESGYGPLRFVAQIDLAEMRDSVATQHFDLPRDGWLAVFATDEDGVQPGVVDRDDDGNLFAPPDLTHVVYVPAPATLVRHANRWGGFPKISEEDRERFGIAPPTPEEATREAENWPCALAFRDSFDLPVAGDVDELGLSDEALDPIEELSFRMRSKWSHKLMGWPCHYRTDNTSPGPDWLDVLTLGSDDALQWSWCDGEFLDVYVHKDGVDDRSFAPWFGYAA